MIFNNEEIPTGDKNTLDEIRPRLSGNKRIAFENLIKKERRILVIGDLHAPFVLEGYLEFCIEQHAKYNCSQIIFIGDILDNHYSSFHPTDPDGMGGGDELKHAVKVVSKWYKEFPVADVAIGNHDRMVMRKAFDSSVPKAWIRGYNEVLETPKWNWVERIIYDNVQYIHGEGGTASTRCKNDMMSTVQGHIHTQAFCRYEVGLNFKVFGMQVGCGIDHESYAAAYAKNFKRQAIGCAVIIGGHTAINCLMDL